MTRPFPRNRDTNTEWTLDYRALLEVLTTSGLERKLEEEDIKDIILTLKALGYKRLITYTLPEEGGGNWNTRTRPRIDTPTLLRGQKCLWTAEQVL